jgi:cellobiose phosphorylase
MSPPVRGQDAPAYYAEPYVMPGNVDGPLSETPGRAGWTWYTGSAAWMNKVALEWVLGIRPTFKGLVIDPCPMPELGKVQVDRQWRGMTIRVQFDARDWEPGASPELMVNGKAYQGHVLDLGVVRAAAGADGVVEVQVTWKQVGEESRRAGHAAAVTGG